ncbi:helix-turn-helix domain-containing protein [Gracilibacillus alcaliphilus]|uniref:helix-turn-helix domain-containing protein n=1 Tax=Gracilibacillus alcaliphilus TaxID=1401441 RepID=UPI00195C0A34|nr:helix-turn-helix transcriptional regulator [Gracilibacillus alcaliphilus]MBM7678929.1 transcriptional regulator with XRE-family HTH domain [Gracilibacillus alcaliphilus]
MNKLGQRIKSLREKNNYSQKRVADAVGISNVQLSRYESGDRKPDPETISLLADFFEVSTDYLLGRTVDPKGNNQSTTEEPELEGFFGYDLDSLSEEEIKELKDSLKKEVEFFLWQKKQQKD